MLAANGLPETRFYGLLLPSAGRLDWVPPTYD